MRTKFIAIISAILIILSGFPALSIEASSAVGKSFAEVFPDAILAQAVSEQVGAASVDDLITQKMINSTHILDLGNLGITDLTGLESFSNLFVLYLENNQITSLPESFADLTQLSSLYLNNNLFTEFPESIVNLRLSGLLLDNNQLESLPDSIGDLDRIIYLSLSNNQLTELPESIGDMSSLVALGLSDNQLETLPDSFGNLKNMQILFINNNHLIELPENIGNLTSLRWLEANDNQLTSLPNSIADFAGPKPFISLENNLLPSDYFTVLHDLGFLWELFDPPRDGSTLQDQLRLINDSQSFDIASQEDLDDIDYGSSVMLDSGRSLLPNHIYILDNYVDEDNQPVDLSDYIQDDLVIKKGKVFASVRATGTGLFPNNSDRALTPETITLNFVMKFSLFFDLNGGSGETPATQRLLEGELALSPPAPIREGYTFLNWNTSIDGSGLIWDFASEVMPSKDLTLYAQWLEDEAPESMGTVIVEYLDESRNTIAPEIILTGEVGTAYTTEQKEIEGFTFVRVEGEKEGFFTKEDIKVSYIYAKDATDPIGPSDPETGLPNTGLSNNAGEIALWVMGLGGFLILVGVWKKRARHE